MVTKKTVYVMHVQTMEYKSEFQRGRKTICIEFAEDAPQ